MSARFLHSPSMDLNHHTPPNPVGVCWNRTLSWFLVNIVNILFELIFCSAISYRRRTQINPPSSDHGNFNLSHKHSHQNLLLGENVVVKWEYFQYFILQQNIVEVPMYTEKVASKRIGIAIKLCEYPITVGA